MYDTIISSTNSRRYTIRCFKVLRRSKPVLVVVTADPSLEYLKINGQKSLNATLMARVCDSWLSATVFHTKLCARFSRNLVMTKREGLRNRSVDGMVRPVLDSVCILQGLTIQE
jgi:hypothetical protein